MVGFLGTLPEWNVDNTTSSICPGRSLEAPLLPYYMTSLFQNKGKKHETHPETKRALNFLYAFFTSTFRSLEWEVKIIN